MYMNKIAPVYPTGSGHYALHSPDGAELRPGQLLKILLAGRRLPGEIRWSSSGDYVQFADQSVCGLHPAMRVVVPAELVHHQQPSRKTYERWTVSRLSLLVERALQLALAEPGRSWFSVGTQIAQEYGWESAITRTRLYRLRSKLERRLAASKEQQLPITLVPGDYPWIVEVCRPQITIIWWLDFAPGSCPLTPGQLCFYNGDLYRVGRTGGSLFSVIQLSSTVRAALLGMQQGDSHVLSSIQ
jgi:hypothetical protein